MAKTEEIEVLCDIDHSPMQMVEYAWRVFPMDNNVTAFMHCLECPRHYSPLQGYVDITKDGIDGSRRRINGCSNEQNESHGSMAIIRVEHGQFIWKCLHSECRGHVTLKQPVHA